MTRRRTCRAGLLGALATVVGVLAFVGVAGAQSESDDELSPLEAALADAMDRRFGIDAADLAAATAASGGMRLLDSQAVVGAAGTDTATDGRTVPDETRQRATFTIRLPGVVAEGDVLGVHVHGAVNSERHFVSSTVGAQLEPVVVGETVSVESLEVGPDGRVRLTVDTSRLEAGVYPVRIELHTGGGQRVSQIFAHVVNAGELHERATGLRVVLSARLPSQRASDAAPWLEMLASHAQLPIAVTVNGATLNDPANAEASAALAEVGTAAASKLTMVQAPFHPINVAVLTDAGLTGEIDVLYGRGAEVLADVAPLEPLTLGSLAQPADAATVDTLAGRGVDYLMLGREGLYDRPRNGVTSDDVDGSTVLRALRPIEVAGERAAMRALLLTELAPRQGHDTAAATAARLVAHLATISLIGSSDVDNPVLAVDVTSSGFNPGAASELLDALYGNATLAELVTLVTPLEALEETGAGEPPLRLYAAAVAPQEVDVSLTDYSAARRDVAAYRSMVADADTAEHDALVEQLLASLAVDIDPAARTATLDAVVDQVQGPLTAVDILTSGTVRLTARSAPVPLSFHNHTDLPLRVELRLDSDRVRAPAFDDQQSTTLWLEPGISTHTFTLETLGSGRYTMGVDLHSPDGALTVDHASVVIQSTAPTGVALLLSIGAFIFLISWWFVDRRRRQRQASD